MTFFLRRQYSEPYSGISPNFTAKTFKEFERKLHRARYAKLPRFDRMDLLWVWDGYESKLVLPLGHGAHTLWYSAILLQTDVPDIVKDAARAALGRKGE